MKTNIFLALPLLVFAAACNQSTAEETPQEEVVLQEQAAEESETAVKKYPVKSGIITFEISNSLEEGSQKKILYFDEYGMKECEETYKDDIHVSSFFSDGISLFMIIPDQKLAYNRGDAFRGVAYKFDWEELSKEDRDSGKFTKGEKMTVAGIECETYKMNEKNMPTLFAGWNNICLYQETTAFGMTEIVKAVDVQTDVAVPAEKFKVPDGFSLQ